MDSEGDERIAGQGGGLEWAAADVEWEWLDGLAGNLGNVSAVGFVDYTVCELWDGFELVEMIASMGGNGALVADATSSAGARGTGHGAPVSPNGNGHIVQIAFPVGLISIPVRYSVCF